MVAYSFGLVGQLGISLQTSPKVRRLFSIGYPQLLVIAPLEDQAKVRITIHTPEDVQKALEAVRRSYGLLTWTGDAETLRQVAEDDEFGILESP